MSLARLRFLTAGESHGKGLTIIVEGVPAGLSLSESDLAVDLARRQKGYGRGGRMQIEKDFAEIMSGVRQGITLGSPIALWVQNRDWENWQGPMSIAKTDKEPNRITRLRPGHADLAGAVKYDQNDVRNILERASARETAARVAGGGVAKRLLSEFGIELNAHVLSISGRSATVPSPIDWHEVEESPVRCADPVAGKRMIKAIDQAKEAGDTAGGVFEVIATGVPIGLGSHIQWDHKLDGRLAQALMSIHAVKGVEIGTGFSQADQMGSAVHDIIEPWAGTLGPRWTRRTNNAGGLEGGMTTGQPVFARVAIKPISTLSKPLPSVDLETGEVVQAHYERSDVCQVPPACVIGESMMAMVLADAFLEKFGGDSLGEMQRNYEAYLAQTGMAR
ncbi:chorismate synthase [Dehalococcoidia bacterium]|nr:chorismate synthase [Dehalococcoidia bacterium]